MVLPLYRSGAVDAVYAVYTQFFSPIRRRPRVVRMLPVEIPAAPEAVVPEATVRWHYEPTRHEMLEELLTVYLRIQLYDVLLESYASEQGARMITMQEATERATKTLQDLRVQHHRLRREAITIDLLQTLFAGTAAES
jgi:F-type H+-transporting ATPase subunit gamma